MAFVVRRGKTIRNSLQAVADPTSVDIDLIPSAYFRWVRVVSRLSAAVLLLPGLPIMILLIMLVHITSRGPGIYRQKRVGLHGRIFTLYKIRTMIHNAEAETGPVWTALNDPRVTKLGRLLRPLHLDELPQLLNVLMGQMTLIGPRPERPEFTQHLARQIPSYMDRYAVMPGITGLAQLNLPPDTDVDSVRRKVVLDLEYIHNANFKTDLRIFFGTALRLFGLPGHFCVRVMKMERYPEIPEYMHPHQSGDGAPTPYHGRLAAHATPSGNGNGVCKTVAPEQDGLPTV